jgi:hypothetical protein
MSKDFLLTKGYIKVGDRIVFYRDDDIYVQYKELKYDDLYDLVKYLSKKRNFGKLLKIVYNKFFNYYHYIFERGVLEIDPDAIIYD